MNIHSLVTRIMVIAALILIPLGIARYAPAVEIQMGGHVPSPAVQGLGQIAVGSVEDTLDACLHRIPADATAGQRLLAEQTCQDYEADRVISQEAPEF